MTENMDNGNFDNAPPVDVAQYDQSIRLFCGAYDEIFKLAHCCLRASLPTEAEVLVVGAGSGTDILEFAPANPQWSFCGVDPSANMLSLAKSKISEKNLSNEIQLVQGYVDDLDEEKTFDAATSILVMHFLEDDGSKLEYLKSISQRLKPGAPLVIVDGCGDRESITFQNTLNAWKQYPILHGVEPEAVENAFKDVILQKVRFVPGSRMLELFDQAGLTNPFKFYSGFLYSGWTIYKQ